MDRGPFLAPVPGGKPERTGQMQPVGEVFVTVLQKNAHDVAKSLRVLEGAPDSFQRMHEHKLSAPGSAIRSPRRAGCRHSRDAGSCGTVHATVIARSR